MQAHFAEMSLAERDRRKILASLENPGQEEDDWGDNGDGSTQVVVLGPSSSSVATATSSSEMMQAAAATLLDQMDPSEPIAGELAKVTVEEFVVAGTLKGTHQEVIVKADVFGGVVVEGVSWDGRKKVPPFVAAASSRGGPLSAPEAASRTRIRQSVGAEGKRAKKGATKATGAGPNTSESVSRALIAGEILSKVTFYAGVLSQVNTTFDKELDICWTQNVVEFLFRVVAYNLRDGFGKHRLFDIKGFDAKKREVHLELYDTSRYPADTLPDKEKKLKRIQLQVNEILRDVCAFVNPQEEDFVAKQLFGGFLAEIHDYERYIHGVTNAASGTSMLWAYECDLLGQQIEERFALCSLNNSFFKDNLRVGVAPMEITPSVSMGLDSLDKGSASGHVLEEQTAPVSSRNEWGLGTSNPNMTEDADRLQNHRLQYLVVTAYGTDRPRAFGWEMCPAIPLLREHTTKIRELVSLLSANLSATCLLLFAGLCAVPPFLVQDGVPILNTAGNAFEWGSRGLAKNVRSRAPDAVVQTYVQHVLGVLRTIHDRNWKARQDRFNALQGKDLLSMTNAKLSGEEAGIWKSLAEMQPDTRPVLLTRLLGTSLDEGGLVPLGIDTCLDRFNNARLELVTKKDEWQKNDRFFKFLMADVQDHLSSQYLLAVYSFSFNLELATALTEKTKKLPTSDRETVDRALASVLRTEIARAKKSIAGEGGGDAEASPTAITEAVREALLRRSGQAQKSTGKKPRPTNPWGGLEPPRQTAPDRGQWNRPPNIPRPSSRAPNRVPRGRYKKFPADKRTVLIGDYTYYLTVMLTKVAATSEEYQDAAAEVELIKGATTFAVQREHQQKFNRIFLGVMYSPVTNYLRPGRRDMAIYEFGRAKKRIDDYAKDIATERVGLPTEGFEDMFMKNRDGQFVYHSVNLKDFVDRIDKNDPKYYPRDGNIFEKAYNVKQGESLLRVYWWQYTTEGRRLHDEPMPAKNQISITTPLFADVVRGGRGGPSNQRGGSGGGYPPKREPPRPGNSNRRAAAPAAGRSSKDKHTRSTGWGPHCHGRKHAKF